MPGHVKVDHYDIDIIAVFDSWIIDGKMAMRGDITLDGVNDDRIPLQFHVLNIDERSLVLDAGTEGLRTFSKFVYDFEREFFWIHYNTPQNSGQSFSFLLSCNYTGVIQGNLFGFYHVAYKVRGSATNDNMAVTQFESAGARHAFPCLDEPSLKARFSLRIGRNSSFDSVANMPKMANTGTEAVPGYPGFVWDEFEESVQMSPYLVAFAVGKFLSVTSNPLPNNLPFYNKVF